MSAFFFVFLKFLNGLFLFFYFSQVCLIACELSFLYIFVSIGFAIGLQQLRRRTKKHDARYVMQQVTITVNTRTRLKKQAKVSILFTHCTLLWSSSLLQQCFYITKKKEAKQQNDRNMTHKKIKLETMSSCFSVKCGDYKQ